MLSQKHNRSWLDAILKRHFTAFIYIFYFSTLMIILWQARQIGLLPMPKEGMYQLTMLTAAADICNGKMPPDNYMYSPVYTAFLAFLVFISRGELLIMRIAQAAICAFIPVMVYKLSLRIRIGRNAAILASLIYCFYAAAALISLDFLRAGPLALCFIGAVYLMVKAFTTKNGRFYFFSGICAGICVLGRENFIPVVVMPLVCLFFAKIRRHVKARNAISYFIGIITCVLPVLVYNYLAHNSFSIIPGALKNIMGVFYGREAVTKGGTPFLQKIMENVPVQCQKFFSSYEIANSLSVYAHRELVEILNVLCLPFNLIMALALVSMAMMNKKYGLVFVAGAIAAYAASISCFDMLYRYRIPCVPLLSCLAGAGLFFIVSRKNRIAIRMALTAIMLVFFFFTYKNPEKLRPAMERISVANALIEIDRLGKAEAYLEKMTDDGIDTSALKLKLLNVRMNEESNTKQ